LPKESPSTQATELRPRKTGTQEPDPTGQEDTMDKPSSSSPTELSREGPKQRPAKIREKERSAEKKRRSRQKKGKSGVSARVASIRLTDVEKLAIWEEEKEDREKKNRRRGTQKEKKKTGGPAKGKIKSNSDWAG